MLMAIGGTEAVQIVRIPSANQVFMHRALDMGAMGVLVPSADACLCGTIDAHQGD